MKCPDEIARDLFVSGVEEDRAFCQGGLADNLVQDWFWWTKMGSFIFSKNYPDPKTMVDELHRDHFHIMISIWSTLQPGTVPFGSMKCNGWFIHMNSPNADGFPAAGFMTPSAPKGTLPIGN